MTRTMNITFSMLPLLTLFACVAQPSDDGEIVEVGSTTEALLSSSEYDLLACGCRVLDSFEGTYLCPYGWETCAQTGGGSGGASTGAGASCSECQLQMHNCFQNACTCESVTSCQINCFAEVWAPLGCDALPNCDVPTTASCVQGGDEPL